MEPIRHVTYYEDVYTRSKCDDDDPVGADGRFDLCEESEDSSDDDTDDGPSKHTKKHPKHLNSYGTIKKPKCKKLFYHVMYSCARANSTKTNRERK
jgi:hypothetical protein